MEGEVDHQWYGQSIETPETRLEDTGRGRPIILRQFTFAYNPGLKVRPTKEQILTPEYIDYLNRVLWVDNLEMIAHPRVAFKKKHFMIFAVCQAKKGHSIPYDKMEQLKPIQNKIQEDYEKRKK